MSKGDNLFGVKRTYKGIEFKSGLECKFARLMDLLKIKWEYEPKKFLLSDGTFYIPDFYLVELKTWIETKGVIEEHNKQISRVFVKDNNTELILLSEEKGYWFSTNDYDCNLSGIGNGEICEDDALQIGKCSECKSYFFCSSLGSYHCRKCGYWDGDHDIISCWDDGLIELELISKEEEKLIKE